MKHTRKVVIIVLVLVATSVSCTSYAQDQGDDDPRGNVHLGMNTAFPVNPTDHYASVGFGLSAGGGYNFNRKNAVLGDFMWNLFPSTRGAVDPLRAALQNGISGETQLYTFTGNYRYELRGRRWGVYFLGGGGWYHRNNYLAKPVTSPAGVVCNKSWLWYGFKCAAGTVTASQTVGGVTSSAFGMNGGFGLTVRVGEAPYRMYVESRYHYAPNKNISTQLVTLSVGIRY